MRAQDGTGEEIGQEIAGTARPSAGSQTWTGHARATIFLALPLVGAQLAQVAFNVTDTVMLGRLGAVELAAGVLATQTFFLFYMFGTGFAAAVMPLAAAAVGRKDTRGVRRSVRMGLWVAGVYSALVAPILWHTETILRFLGQNPDVADLAGSYVRVALWAMLPAQIVMVMRSYLSVAGRAYVVLGAVIIGAIANVFLNTALIFGHFGAPALGVVGSALATLISQILMASLLVLYTALAPTLKKSELYVRFWRADVPAIAEIVRLGWPIGLTIIAEVGLFATASVMMGWLGTVPLAAHGIALQIASVSFMVPLGLANAATVRVGIALGQGDRLALGRAGFAALGISLAIAVGAAILFWAVPDRLIGLYLDPSNPKSGAVLTYAVPLLLVGAAFQIADAMQAVGSGILRGIRDTRRPMMIALFSYWLLGMPTAYLLAFTAGWGGVGVWWGLAFGLAAAAALMNRRFHRREALGLIEG